MADDELRDVTLRLGDIERALGELSSVIGGHGSMVMAGGRMVVDRSVHVSTLLKRLSSVESTLTTHSHAFDDLTSTPETVEECGLSDVYTKTEIDNLLDAMDTLAEMDDVTISGPSDNDLLQYDANSSMWVDRTLAQAGVAAAGHTHALDDLTDVSISGGAAGEVITWSGSEWVDGYLPHGSLIGTGVNDHHDRDHDIEGSTHTASGLTAGYVLRASGADAFAFAELQHSDLGGVGTNDHHNRWHAINSADHTLSGATAGQILGVTSATTFSLLTPTSPAGLTWDYSGGAIRVGLTSDTPQFAGLTLTKSGADTSLSVAGQSGYDGIVGISADGASGSNKDWRLRAGDSKGALIVEYNDSGWTELAYWLTSGMFLSAGKTLTVGSTLTANGAVRLSNGSAATPAIAFANDTDTGFYRGGSGLISLAVAGSEVAYWDDPWLTLASGKGLKVGSGVVRLQSGGLIAEDTSDGSDDSYIDICGGGSNGNTRGALISLYGNEHASYGGHLVLHAGDVAGGVLQVYTGDAIACQADDSQDWRFYGGVRADSGFNVNGSDGWSGTFTNGDGDTVTVSGGIITGVA